MKPKTPQTNITINDDGTINRNITKTQPRPQTVYNIRKDKYADRKRHRIYKYIPTKNLRKWIRLALALTLGPILIVGGTGYAIYNASQKATMAMHDQGKKGYLRDQFNYEHKDALDKLHFVRIVKNNPTADCEYNSRMFREYSPIGKMGGTPDPIAITENNANTTLKNMNMATLLTDDDIKNSPCDWYIVYHETVTDRNPDPNTPDIMQPIVRISPNSDQSYHAYTDILHQAIGRPSSVTELHVYQDDTPILAKENNQ